MNDHNFTECSGALSVTCVDKEIEGVERKSISGHEGKSSLIRFLVAYYTFLVLFYRNGVSVLLFCC